MKRLTGKNRILLKEALKRINKGIRYYKSEGINKLYPIGMCHFMDNEKLTMKEDNIFTAFYTTKPKGMQGCLYWYPRFDIQSRINHLTKIKKEIEVVLKQGYY